MKSAMIAFAFLFSVSAMAAEEVKFVKIPADQLTLTPDYGVRMNSVCYNPDYGLGAYQTCQDDLQILDIMSTSDVSLSAQCQYVSGCGPWSQSTYQLDVVGYVGR
ncbi:MAG: hypothetical protein V4692_13790 [Bdellovibrionota bacterium]